MVVVVVVGTELVVVVANVGGHAPEGRALEEPATQYAINVHHEAEQWNFRLMDPDSFVMVSAINLGLARYPSEDCLDCPEYKQRNWLLTTSLCANGRSQHRQRYWHQPYSQRSNTRSH